MTWTDTHGRPELTPADWFGADLAEVRVLGAPDEVSSPDAPGSRPGLRSDPRPPLTLRTVLQAEREDRHRSRTDR